MGNIVDLETTVADLMRTGALSAGILGSIGSMISGLGSIAGGKTMLSAMGITNGISTLTTGSGDVLKHVSGASVSESGYIGNASGSDVKNAVLSEADNTVEQKSVEAQESEDADVKNKVIDEHIIQIYELLQDVITGGSAFTVSLKDTTVVNGVAWNR